MSGGKIRQRGRIRRSKIRLANARVNLGRVKLDVSRSGPRLFVAALALFFGACLDLFDSANERPNNAGLDASSVDGSDAWPGSGGTGATGGAKESGAGGSGAVTGGTTGFGGFAGSTGGSSCVPPDGSCSDVSECCNPEDSLCQSTCCRKQGSVCSVTGDCCDPFVVCGDSQLTGKHCCSPLGASCAGGAFDCCALDVCDPQKLKCCSNGVPCTNEDQCCTGFVCALPAGKSATECCRPAGGDCSAANLCCTGSCNPSTKKCD